MAKRRLIFAYPRVILKGFTIVELLVVIVVIAILAAITIVSYTGITNRATIASIQSDLTNASTLLKMDYTTNSTFPTTLALANSGKGITQSQSLDSIIYVPDNTSNPSNFCLQYRKGTNTYAVDNNSAPSSGVCLQNLVTNGDFRNGTTGWNPNGLATFITSSNVVTAIANSQYDLFLQEIPNYSSYKGHILYFFATLKTYSSSVALYLQDGVGFPSLPTIADNAFHRLSNRMTVSMAATKLQVITQDGRTSGWDTFYVKEIGVIDLTATFGVGNETTQAQMDTIMTNYPNNWFNIVAKANL